MRAMQNTIRKWLNRPFKKAETPDFPALLAKLETKPMEKPMSAEVLGPSINRAVGAYKKLQDAHAAAAAMILEQDKKIAHDAVVIADYKAILDEVFPEDMGGSTGGVVG